MPNILEQELTYIHIIDMSVKILKSFSILYKRQLHVGDFCLQDVHFGPSSVYEVSQSPYQNKIFF